MTLGSLPAETAYVSTGIGEAGHCRCALAKLFALPAGAPPSNCDFLNPVQVVNEWPTDAIVAKATDSEDRHRIPERYRIEARVLEWGLILQGIQGVMLRLLSTIFHHDGQADDYTKKPWLVPRARIDSVVS